MLKPRHQHHQHHYEHCQRTHCAQSPRTSTFFSRTLGRFFWLDVRPRTGSLVRSWVCLSCTLRGECERRCPPSAKTAEHCHGLPAPGRKRTCRRRCCWWRTCLCRLSSLCSSRRGSLFQDSVEPLYLHSSTPTETLARSTRALEHLDEIERS